jgi:hypothetical protein
MAAVIAATGLTKRYGTTIALDSLELGVQAARGLRGAVGVPAPRSGGDLMRRLGGNPRMAERRGACSVPAWPRPSPSRSSQTSSAP